MCETNTSMLTRSSEVSPSLTSAAAQCGPGGNLGARVDARAQDSHETLTFLLKLLSLQRKLVANAPVI